MLAIKPTTYFTFRTYSLSPAVTDFHLFPVIPPESEAASTCCRELFLILLVVRYLRETRIISNYQRGVEYGNYNDDHTYGSDDSSGRLCHGEH